MEDFLKAYQPDAAPAVPAQTLAEYQNLLPAALLDLWQRFGFCQFGGGLLRLIDPAHYRPELETWLGGDKPTYFPIALGGFGHLFYYRRLTPTDEDVCLLDPHYRRVDTCTWDLNSFFNDYLTDEEIRQDILLEPLFQEAQGKLGTLAPNEIFSFAPALILGGSEELKYVVKADAPTNLQLLFDLGN